MKMLEGRRQEDIRLEINYYPDTEEWEVNFKDENTEEQLGVRFYKLVGDLHFMLYNFQGGYYEAI